LGELVLVADDGLDDVLAAEVDLLVAVGDAERVAEDAAAGWQVEAPGERFSVDAAAWVGVDDADDLADERPVRRKAS
jgi:uncharacterized protein YaiE (UPF0345 family)